MNKVTELNFVCTALPGPSNECVFVELEDQNGKGIGGVGYPEIEWKNREDGLVSLNVPYVSPAKYAEMKRLLEEYQYSVPEHGPYGDFWYSCPECGGSGRKGHVDNCRIGNALKEE